jgi:hypothetical protein
VPGGPKDRVSEGAAAAELVRGRPPAQFSPKIRASRSVETLQLAFIDSLALTRRFMRRFMKRLHAEASRHERKGFSAEETMQ